MNKSLKDSLIENIAKKMKISQAVVDVVVTSQFKEMVKAMHRGCNSVEMTGFGVFYFLPVKAKKMMTSLEGVVRKMENNEEYNLKIAKPLEGLKEDIAFFKNHLEYVGESKTDSRGLEERADKKARRRRHSKAKDGDLQQL